MADPMSPTSEARRHHRHHPVRPNFWCPIGRLAGRTRRNAFIEKPVTVHVLVVLLLWLQHRNSRSK
jgi:hypothetical protein